MMARWHEIASKVALCHLLLAGALVLTVFRLWVPVALLCLAVGFGGTGAAWSLWSEQTGHWLDIVALRSRPSATVVRTLAEHFPFLAVGVGLVLWKVSP